MNDNLVNKVFLDEMDNEILVIEQLTYKNIKCVYGQNKKNNNEKKFYQVTSDGEIKLVNIESKKLINELNQLFQNKLTEHKSPRKIKEDETIADYLAYLDDFYKKQVNTVL